MTKVNKKCCVIFFFSCFTGTFQFHMSLVKGFAVWHLLPLARKYLSSTTSSCFFMVRHIYSRFANSKLYSLFLCLQYHCVFIFYCSRHAINIFWMQSNRLDRLPRSWSELKFSENVFVKIVEFDLGWPTFIMTSWIGGRLIAYSVKYGNRNIGN